MILHTPVLSNEVLSALNIKDDGCYVDATYGRGGHANLILKSLGDQAILHVVDRDPEAISHAKEFLNDKRVSIHHTSFSDMGKFLNENTVDGILFDLGVSSPQLDNADRGFSFRKTAVLDMRFDHNSGLSAHQWLNSATCEEIADVIHHYGQERMARKIAKAIVAKRPIYTTTDLANLIAAIVSKPDSKIHPATRTFQALRIYVNDEFSHIEKAFLSAGKFLKIGGRLVVLTFHGLETRMVKSLARGQSLLVGGNKPSHFYKIIQRSEADLWEKRDNPRSRSAQLIVLEKIK